MTTAPPPAAFDPALRRMAVAVALGATMTVLDTTIVNVAVHVLGRELDASLSDVQWVLTGYTLALSMTIPVAGWAIGRLGARTVWLTSLVLFAGGSLLCGAAWSAASLVAFRVLQGVGGGLLMPVGLAMLARQAGPGRMGRVMAVVSVPAMLAPALGPVLGGLLLERLPWRWMFYVNVPVCLAALVLAVRLIPPDTGRRSAGGPDVPGLLLLCPGLALLVHGLAQAGDGSALDGARVTASAAAGVLLVGAYVGHALRRGDRALIDVRVFGHRAFAASAAAVFCYSVALFGVLILIPLQAQTVRGGDTLDAGLLVAPLGLGAAATMPLAGRLTDRYGPRAPGVGGILVVLAGIAWYTRVDGAASLALPAAAVLLIGIGHGIVMPSIPAAAFRDVPVAAIPTASTAATIVARVGSAVGAALLAVVLQTLMRSAAGGSVPAATEAAFTAALGWSFAIALASLVPALLLPGGRPAPPEPEAAGAAEDAADGTVAEELRTG
jgi:EmrB/QacA subfamily drug resistance transporter